VIAFDRPPAERYRMTVRTGSQADSLGKFRHHPAAGTSPTPRASADKESKRLPLVIVVVVVLVFIRTSEQLRQDHATNSTPPQHASAYEGFDDATLLAGCLVIFVVFALILVRVAESLAHQMQQDCATDTTPPQHATTNERSHYAPLFIVSVLILVFILRTSVSEQVREDHTTNSTPPQHASSYQGFDDATLLAGCLVIFVVFVLILVAESLSHQMQQDCATDTTPPKHATTNERLENASFFVVPVLVLDTVSCGFNVVHESVNCHSSLHVGIYSVGEFELSVSSSCHI
jgi:hypothetical protein